MTKYKARKPIVSQKLFVLSSTQVAEFSPGALSTAHMNEEAVRMLLGESGYAWFIEEMKDTGGVLLEDFLAKAMER